MITGTVSFPSGGAELQAYPARPDGAAPVPALVLIHEAYGLNDDMRRIARQFAEAGYAALAVDLFYGRNRAVCMFRTTCRTTSRSIPAQLTPSSTAGRAPLTRPPAGTPGGRLLTFFGQHLKN